MPSGDFSALEGALHALLGEGDFFLKPSRYDGAWWATDFPARFPQKAASAQAALIQAGWHITVQKALWLISPGCRPLNQFLSALPEEDTFLSASGIPLALQALSKQIGKFKNDSELFDIPFVYILFRAERQPVSAIQLYEALGRRMALLQREKLPLPHAKCAYLIARAQKRYQEKNSAEE